MFPRGVAARRQVWRGDDVKLEEDGPHEGVFQAHACIRGQRFRRGRSARPGSVSIPEVEEQVLCVFQRHSSGLVAGRRFHEYFF